MKYLIALFLFACIFHTTQVLAQCAPGIPEAGNPECLPPDDANSPYYQGSRGHQPTETQQTSVVWADRWGAIARDEESGDAGTIEGQDNKSKANQIAMDICQRNGAKHCQVVLSFYNQCAAAALGKKIMNASGGPTVQSAQQTAISRCGGQAEECKIVYSACSLPVRVQ